MSRSLQASEDLERCGIEVFDDSSTEFELDTLKHLFPPRSKVTRRSRTLGSDENARQMYIEFMKSNADLIVTADADLIFHPQWLKAIESNFSKTDGVLSLYNSMLHPTIRKSNSGGEVLCEKEHIGAAATVFHRDVLKQILEHFDRPTISFDFKWSAFLRKKKIKILTTERSYVQHIGLSGINCDGLRELDYGLNFDPGNEVNAKILAQFFEEFAIQNNELKEQRVELIDRLIQTRLKRIAFEKLLRFLKKFGITRKW